MQNKTPIFYDEQQQKRLITALEEAVGKTDGKICHEITSEYVHTDTLVLGDTGEEMVFATFGMSARRQNTPLPLFERVELMAFTAEEPEADADKLLICSELCRISKYPFREDSWLGLGHTMDACAQMKERFGYAYYAFLGPVLTADVDGEGDVFYLALVPLYKEEWDWIVQHDTFEFFDAYTKKHGDLHFCIDQVREKFIP